jgi:tRNA(Ser,Leu) C12 N-acetylase TAN1
MELVAFLGNDKENWGQISALVNRFECDKIFLVGGSDAQEFPATGKCVRIKFDVTKPLLELQKEIIEKLKLEINKEFEVAVSIASGSGKEHMALISALLNVPVGIRLVVYTKEGVKFIN